MRVALAVSASSAPVSLYPLTVERTYPTELAAAVARGAVVVDIRTSDERAVQGTFPGALAIEMDVLADRLDPRGPLRLAVAVDHDVEWILVSAEGVESHRIVAVLQQRGLRRATHLDGGYAAIKKARMVETLAEAQHIAADVSRTTAH